MCSVILTCSGDVMIRSASVGSGPRLYFINMKIKVVHANVRYVLMKV